jgi:hypothetical protein
MTSQYINDEPSIVARYEDVKAAAGAYGFRLQVVRRAQNLFVLMKDSETVCSCRDIAHIEEFLRGVQLERDRRATKQRIS